MNATNDQPIETTTTGEQDAQPAAEVDRRSQTAEATPGNDGAGANAIGPTPNEANGNRRATSLDVRESLVNDRRCGPAHEIAVPLNQVCAIHSFMFDVDCNLLNPAVVGEEASNSADVLYEQHVRRWLDRDNVLAKAEVRHTGGGLHVLLWLDTPILCAGGEAQHWDRVIRVVRNALPGDPRVNGVLAMTRPVGAVNTKFDQPRAVRRLRDGSAITRSDILGLGRRINDDPAHLWMRLFFDSERVSPCPICAKGESLGVAGKWQCQCYECGRIDAAALVYRFFSPSFLKSQKGDTNG